MRAGSRVASMTPAAGALAVGSAVILASCSLVTSTDGLSGAETDDAGGVGSIDGGGGRPPDASSGVESGVADATDDALPSSAGSFCASLSPAPLFCDDFDDGPLAARWDSVVAVEGVVALYADGTRSPPQSMWVTTSTQSDIRLQAFVAKAFASWTARPMTATLDVDVRVDRATAADMPLVAIQLLEPTGKLYEVQLRATGGGASLATVLREHTRDGTADAVSDRGLAQPLAQSAWSHVQIQLTYRLVTASRARVSIDGVTVLDAPVAPSTVSGTPRAALGVTAVYGPTDPWAIRYDNAVFDAVP